MRVHWAQSLPKYSSKNGRPYQHTTSTPHPRSYFIKENPPQTSHSNNYKCHHTVGNPKLSLVWPFLGGICPCVKQSSDLKFSQCSSFAKGVPLESSRLLGCQLFLETWSFGGYCFQGVTAGFLTVTQSAGKQNKRDDWAILFCNRTSDSPQTAGPPNVGNPNALPLPFAQSSLASRASKDTIARGVQ